jgi:ribosomal protein L30/L7E
VSNDSFVFNNETSGSGNQINQGQTVNAMQDNRSSGETVDAQQFFDAIRQQLPENTAVEVVTPLEVMASMPVDVQEEKPETAGMLERIKPYAGAIQRGLLGFSRGALDALASNNPVVRGVLEAVKSVESE